MRLCIIKCSICGQKDNQRLYHRPYLDIVHRLLDQRICFDCAYWLRWLENPDPEVIIASRNAYKPQGPLLQPTLSQAKRKGLIFLADPNTFEMWALDKPVLIGDIPKALSDKLPDRFKIIDKSIYLRKLKFQSDCCMAKGCFDRYRCLWYNAEAAEPDEPYNKIPKNYQVGSENCPSFIDKQIFL